MPYARADVVVYCIFLNFIFFSFVYFSYFVYFIITAALCVLINGWMDRPV